MLNSFLHNPHTKEPAMRQTALTSWTAAVVLVFAAVALIVPPAAATIIYVPDPEPTIAAGIAAASPGDTVMIACDTYYEHGLVVSSAITLTSTTGYFSCVTIDGEATDTILYLTEASGAVVTGITFTNGAALFGAGVEVDSCDVAFHHCKFYNNTAEVEGGGLRYRYGNPDISYCDFSSSRSPQWMISRSPAGNSCSPSAESKRSIRML